MPIDWNRHRDKKKPIKLKYLQLLKRRFGGEVFNIRREITEWALRKYIDLQIPEDQFGGRLDHSVDGLFVKEHGFVVTQKGIRSDAKKAKLDVYAYIDMLISKVRKSKS